MPIQQHIIIVGAGIIGASIAYHLAKAGARVTVVSQQAGGVATPNSFAWINASWGNAPSYARFRMQAMANWHRLKAEIPNLPIAFNGGILWDLPPKELEVFATEHTALGYKLMPLDRAAIRAREPRLAAPPPFALYAPDEGALEPEETAKLLLVKALALGAAHHSAAVTGITSQGDKISGIVTSQGKIAADHVIIAAGAASKELAKSVGVSLPIEAPAGLLVRTHPCAPLLSGLVLSPDLHMRQDQYGRIIAGGDYGGSQPGGSTEDTAKELLSKLKSMFKDPADIMLDGHSVGYRPMPGDGLPIIGSAGDVSGLSFAVMHSGVTLAALVGRLLSSEIVSAVPSPELEPYRLTRFS